MKIKEVGFLIVGSGVSSLHFAQTLIKQGEKVTILDIGKQSESANFANDKNFDEIRRNEKDQYKLFLGEKLEGIEWDNDDLQKTLTPKRQYIIRKANSYLPYISNNFKLIQSVVAGGLANAWGAGAAPYNKEELQMMGLPYNEIFKSYREISKRIPLSSEYDDLEGFLSKETIKFEEPIKRDCSINQIRSKYFKKRQRFNNSNIFLGQIPLAINNYSQNSNKYMNNNLDLYQDCNASVYRPVHTLNELLKSGLLEYIPNAYVLSFKENTLIKTTYKDLITNQEKEIFSKFLFLGAGAVGSSRIVLRSFNSSTVLPLLSNEISESAFLNLSSLGSSMNSINNCLGQTDIFYGKPNDTGYSLISLYTYSSLLVTKLVKYVPFLSYKASLNLLNKIQSSIVIGLINHPDNGSNKIKIKRLLDNDSISNDTIKIEREKNFSNSSINSKLIKALFSMNCIYLTSKKEILGSSVHYAGTIPYNEKNNEFFLNSDGKLNCSKNVYVIDGSGFRYLPAAGLTFTLMANAERIGRHILKGKIS